MVRAAARAPLTSIELADRFSGAVATYVGAEIDATGSLVLSSEESATMCEAARGDLDAEQWLAVPREWKDELLLRLLSDRFGSVEAVREYLAAHGIPYGGHATGGAAR